MKSNPDWTYEAIAFHIQVPQGGACTAGTEAVYRSFYPGGNVSQSNHRFLPDLTMHQKMAGVVDARGRGHVRAAVDCADSRPTPCACSSRRPSDPPTRWCRTLARSASTPSSTSSSRPRGSRYSSNKYVPAGQARDLLPTDPNPYCFRDYYSLFQLQNDFFRNALANDDQLRQRVAFALSQIFVTSGLDINLAYGMATYQQIFLDHAFGNYETLMTRVTLSSVMGEYLNMVNNDKPVAGTNPNENYARELLQLFSIGLWEQNLDGTLAARRRRPADPDVRPGDGRGLRARVHGLDLSRCCPGSRSARTTSKNFLGDMTAVRVATTTRAPSSCSTAPSRRQASPWRPISPTRSATCSSIRTSARSSASSSSRSS